MIKEINLDNISILDNSLVSKEEVLSYFNSNPFAKFFVYLDNNAIVGFLYYSDIYDRIEINQITIFDEYRKKGYGSKLISYLVSLNKPISLEVKADNNAAIHLYEKYGFKIVSVRKGYYKGIDGYLMILEKK